jgi:hypothetical protein
MIDKTAVVSRRERLLALAIASAVLVGLLYPVFNNFFYGDDWNDFVLYLRSDGNFVRAIFTPSPPFFRPAAYAWVIASQLVLPWNTTVHYGWVVLLTLVNVYLLYQIMQLLTRSVAARVLGIALFVFSKLHVTLVGVPLLLEMVVQLMHFLMALLGLLLYVRIGRTRYLAVSVAAFTLCVFSRDASILLLAPIFAIVALRHKNPWCALSRAQMIREIHPFGIVALFYLVVRFSIMPPIGQDGYAIGFSAERMARKTAEVIGNVVNLSVPVNSSNGIDLAWFLPPGVGEKARVTGLLLSIALLVWTAIIAFRGKRLALFCVVWAGAVILPTLAIGISAVYYSYELVAALAVMVAVAADQENRFQGALRVAWVVVLSGVAVGAYFHNQNLNHLGWYYSGELAKRVYADIVAPNQKAKIKSMVIVTPDATEAQRVGYLLGPNAEGHGNAMLSSLLAQRVPLRVFVPPAADTQVASSSREMLDQMARDPDDFVYVFDAKSFAFHRHTPFRVGECLESFEGEIELVRPAWVENSKTALQINREPAYVSDGRQSLLIDTKAAPTPGAHYGGVRLPAPGSTGFTLDLFVKRSEALKAIHVWEVDAQGNPVYGWANTSPGKTIQASRFLQLEFVRQMDRDPAFVWNRDLKNTAAPVGVFVIFETQPGGETKVYLDRFCSATK